MLEIKTGNQVQPSAQCIYSPSISDIAGRKKVKHGFSVWDPDVGLSVSSWVSMGSASWARMQGFVALILSFRLGENTFLFGSLDC